MSPHALLCDTGVSTEGLLLKKFAVTANGFLPAEPPLYLLPDDYYAPWERLSHNLPARIQDGTLREEVQQLKVLSTSHLQSEAEWRRAYVILGFLAQAYIWGGDRPAEVLPPPISVPFLQVSNKLELAPVLTYAASNLWNFSSKGRDFADLDGGLVALHTFTGTPDESWFYMVSVAMEQQAGRAIPAVARALDGLKTRDRDHEAVVSEALDELAGCIRAAGTLLERMHERCDPHVFFHRIRPFLAGSRNMAAAGLPRGVLYDTGGGGGDWMRLRGGSNGQSSLVQFFDVVLGVRHGREGGHGAGDGNGDGDGDGPSAPGRLGEKPRPAGEEGDAPPKQPPPPPVSFHDEVRTYMPGPHRRFLQHVARAGSIRALAARRRPGSSPGQARLRAAYGGAAAALEEFRDKHIRLVTRYIVLPARQSKVGWDGHGHGHGHGHKGRGRRDLAAASVGGGARGEELTGTGGTTLIPFLKQARDDTARAGVLALE